MRVLVTGANGFIAKNLVVRLSEIGNVEIVSFTREHKTEDLAGLLKNIDWIFHLAGVNRPESPDEFVSGNFDFSRLICSAITKSNRSIPVVFTSSIQAEGSSDYGASKLAAEQEFLDLNKRTGNPVYIYRLPNVFGKWAKPNYNSVVATFCYNISRDIEIQIGNPSATIKMVYIDDLVENFQALLQAPLCKDFYRSVTPEYQITVRELADVLRSFRAIRHNHIVNSVGVGVTRALYSTYVSYLPKENFTYTLEQHADHRGRFVEMLKTHESGQFSFFSAHPGVTRGGHYHHSKTEKFLVVSGQALFKFQHILSGETYQLQTSGERPEIVETVPGWSHDITNIGKEELVCMLWANEIFSEHRPDTVVSQIDF